LDWTQTLFDVIDFRSFSSIWYWIVLAVVWSSSSHWVLGVPFDMVFRARKQGGRAMADLEDLVRINVDRILYVARSAGLALAGLVAFLLTVLAMLAFRYDAEFAQAVVLIFLPLAVVGAMTLSVAARIEAQAPVGEALCRALARHRLWTQLVGMLSIFVTAMFGMYQNLQVLQGF
jgi:hypothetical protein